MTDTEREQMDQEPVWYCEDCLSLKIISINEEQCFCDQCGNMNIATTDINTWNKLYEEKYKHKFIENGRKSRYVWADKARQQ